MDCSIFKYSQIVLVVSEIRRWQVHLLLHLNHCVRLNLRTWLPLLNRLLVSEWGSLGLRLVPLLLGLLLFFTQKLSHSSSWSLAAAALQNFIFPWCLGCWLSVEGRSCRPLFLFTLLGRRYAIEELIGSALACLLLCLHLRHVWLSRWQIMVCNLASGRLQMQLCCWRH
jgi:hypothetical protein